MSCPICLESISYPYITDCCHAFCTECFEDWKTEKIANCADITCPVCRTILEKNVKVENNEEENEYDDEDDEDDEDVEDAEDEITSQNTNYETDADYEPNSEYEYEDY